MMMNDVSPFKGYPVFFGAWLLSSIFAATAVAAEMKGRFVRIEQRGVLNLSEVEVFVGGVNVALGKKVAQSSVGYGGVPERAVDGNRCGAWCVASVCHTGEGPTEWWEVDLGAVQAIDGIAVWNRTDGVCTERIVGATLKILDEQRQATWQGRFDEPQRSYAFGAVPALKRESYPSVKLANGVVELVVYLPDAEKGYYRERRFDWSSMAGRLVYRGHDWFEDWRGDPHMPSGVIDDGSGPSSEFGSGNLGTPPPPGFVEAGPGGTFMKIGVGELRRPVATEAGTADPAYGFGFPYPVVRIFPWTFTNGADWIELVQESLAVNGYRYRLVRRFDLTVSPPGFVMKCQFENRGEKAIEQTCYDHNFICLDGRLLGPDTRLVYAYPLILAHPQGDDVLVIKDRTVSLRRKFGFGDSAAMVFSGFDDTPAGSVVTVWQDDLKTGLRIRSDQPLERSLIYCAPTAVCPESHVLVAVPPGATKRWETRYEFVDAP
jgi:hypothetical protein